jgi:hypothetical protein
MVLYHYAVIDLFYRCRWRLAEVPQAFMGYLMGKHRGKFRLIANQCYQAIAYYKMSAANR